MGVCNQLSFLILYYNSSRLVSLLEVINAPIQVPDIVDLTTSKSRVVKSMMFLYSNIHEYTWTSPDGKTHNHIDHVLIERRWHSSILDVRSFRGADSDTDHFLVVAKVRERLAVNKQSVQNFDKERFNLSKLNELVVKNIIRLRLQTGLQLWRT